MNKIGIVFSGGGGKGAYELGVWKALHELGLDMMISGVSGTSIGGLNSIIFASRDYDDLANLWERAKVDKRRLPKILNSFPVRLLEKKVKREQIENIYGAFDNWIRSRFLTTKKLNNFIMQEANIEKFRQSDCDCYITCHDKKKKEAVYFHLNSIEDEMKIYKVLRATASIPLIFKAVKLEKYVLCDGGLSDNTPIRPLYEQGFKKIIVVLLAEPTTDYQELYPDTKIYTVVPQKSLGKFADGCLNFYSDIVDERINQGYTEMLEFLKSHPDLFQERLLELAS